MPKENSFKTQYYAIKNAKRKLKPFTFCIRKPDSRMRAIYKAEYKKGFEVRISLLDEEQVLKITGILSKNSISAGSTFIKSNRLILPLYGKENLIKFLKIIIEL